MCVCVLCVSLCLCVCVLVCVRICARSKMRAYVLNISSEHVHIHIQVNNEHTTCTRHKPTLVASYAKKNRQISFKPKSLHAPPHPYNRNSRPLCHHEFPPKKQDCTHICAYVAHSRCLDHLSHHQKKRMKKPLKMQDSFRVVSLSST
jgi:hypothetical protein